MRSTNIPKRRRAHTTGPLWMAVATTWNFWIDLTICLTLAWLGSAG